MNIDSTRFVPGFDIKRASREDILAMMRSQSMQKYTTHGPSPSDTNRLWLFDKKLKSVIWDWLDNNTVQPEPEPDPIITQRFFTYEDLQYLLPYPQVPWKYPHDSEKTYGAVLNENLMMTVVLAGGVSRVVYIKGKRDCEDITCIGQATIKKDDRTVDYAIFDSWWKTPVGGHSVGEFFVIDGSRLVQKLIEFQTDTIFFPPPDWTFLRREG